MAIILTEASEECFFIFLMKGSKNLNLLKLLLRYIHTWLFGITQIQYKLWNLTYSYIILFCVL